MTGVCETRGKGRGELVGKLSVDILIASSAVFIVVYLHRVSLLLECLQVNSLQAPIVRE